MKIYTELWYPDNICILSYCLILGVCPQIVTKLAVQYDAHYISISYSKKNQNLIITAISIVLDMECQ